LRSSLAHSPISQLTLSQSHSTCIGQVARLKTTKVRRPAFSARPGQLDDYYILAEVTVYFSKGRVNVDPKYTPPLLELVQKAKTYVGDLVQGGAAPGGGIDHCS